MTPKTKKRLTVFLVATAVLAAASAFYVKSHPLVFNESFIGHAHCIVGAGMSFRQYAGDHGGRFPFSTNGYGDALVKMNSGWDESLTGLGYNANVFERVRRTGELAPNSEFGRVYVQGLSETNNPEIVLLFDKLPTPGGDHCHVFQRLFAPLCREVCLIDGDRLVIPETKWPAYSRHQIELLVAAGIPKQQAEMYY